MNFKTITRPRIHFLTLALLLIWQYGYGQGRCGFDAAHQDKLANDPAYAAKVQQINNQWTSMMNNPNGFVNYAASGTTYTIPVVVHVVHTGGSVGSIYNPSDASIQSMIDYLNATYAATYGSYPDTNSGGVYFPVKFVLAKRSPTCASTTGINRVDGSGVTGYSANGIKSSSTGTGADEATVKALSHWNNSDYYNIWVVNKIDGMDGTSGTFIAGYAYFPGAPYSLDGTIMLATQVSAGSITLPHEMGHAFGLYHTFEGDANGTTCPTNSNCTTDGDEVCDTEPHIRTLGSCPSSNPCTGNNSATVIKNIMNYATCQDRFTAGQRTRFLSTMLSSRPGLLGSWGAVPTGTNVTTNSCSFSLTNTGNSANMGPTKVTLNDMTSTSAGYNNEGNQFYIDRSCVQRAHVIQGQSYTLSVETATNPQKVAVYIDYNNDGSFTPGELVYSHTGSIAAETHSTTYNVPTSGVTTCIPLRMRVVADWYGTSLPANGCGTLAYGQVEDFAVYVEPASMANLSLTNALTSGVNPSCTNASLTFTATPSSSLTSPTYTWYKNGVSVTTGTTYTASTAITNNNYIQCKVNYTNACSVADSMFSNIVTITRQSSPVTPSVSILASPSSVTTTTTSVLFTATPTNGGTSPAYQWYLNSSAVSGATNSTYTNASWGGTDQVYCVMTPNLCASPTTATSSTITMTLPATIPTVTSISPVTGAFGSSVTITGTNFNTTAANNIVYFGGGAKGSVTGASATSLTVTVPAGAKYGPITVMNNDGNPRMASSGVNFSPTYTGNGLDFADSTFTGPTALAGNNGLYSVAVADFDGDGKLDIAASHISGNLCVYRNTSTSGSLSTSSFTTKTDLTGVPNSISVRAADIDNDGKLDLIASNTGSTIYLLKNQSTSGTISFASPATVTVGNNDQFMNLADIDGDGRQDILINDSWTSNLYVLRNITNAGVISSSSFASAVNYSILAPYDVATGDLDGDGKLDVVTTSWLASAANVYRNASTSGTISLGSPTSLTLSGAKRVAIADVDADGKSDVIIGTDNSTIAIYKNNSTSGSITLGSAVIFNTPGPVDDIQVADLNGDSKPDITASCGSKIFYLKNVATSGSIATSSFFVSSVASGGTARAIGHGDLDGDGKTDLVYGLDATTSSITVARKQSLTKPVITALSAKSGNAGSSITITGTGFNPNTSGNKVYFGSTSASVTAASATSLTVTVPTGATYGSISVLNKAPNLTAFSSDNFSPVFSGTAGEFVSASFNAKVDFTTGTNPYHVAIGDLDGDGKADMVTANNSANTVSLFRNTATSGTVTSGSFATKVDLTTGTAPRYVAIKDIDGDGKPEVIAANNSSGTVSVFKNNSTSGSLSFASKVDYTVGTNPVGIIARDLDGDGLVDIATSNSGSNNISLLQNTGYRESISSATFNTVANISTGATGIGVLGCADIDGDGKADLAVPSTGGTKAIVYRNTAAPGTLNATSFATGVDFTTASTPDAVQFGDIDGDGKPEMAVSTLNNISVFRNAVTSGITTGSFAAKVDFGGGGYEPENLAIGDLDGDGKAEVAFANANASTNTVTILQNNATSGSISASSFAAPISFATATLPGMAAIADLDGDGRNDLVAVNRTSNSVSVLRKDFFESWTGATSNNWSTASNWSKNAIPVSTDYVVIASGTPNLASGTTSIQSLDMRSGAILSISSGATLNVTGSLSHSGAVSGAGMLTLNGSSAQTITGTGTVANITLNNTSGATITSGNTLNVTDSYTPTAGTLTTNGGLILKSSLTATARIAAFASGSISGNVNVERYIPALNRRAWRLLSAPVQSTGAPTIYSSWQEGGTAPAGYGTLITQAGGAAVANSFDAGLAASTSSSIRQYNSGSNTLTTPATTNVAVTSQPAWFVFVRGDRTLNISTPGISSNTTLRMSGLVNSGNQNFTVPSTNFALVGNPYPSPIDFALAVANAATTNTLTKFWVWDPKLNTSGGYVLFDAGLSYVPSVTGGSYSAANSIIQSGQGFFIKSNGTAGNFRVQEDDKASTHQNVFKTTNGNDALLRVRLNMNDGTGFVPADGVIAAFNSNNSANVDDEDGEKMTHFGVNIAWMRSGQFLTIEKRPDAVNSDTLHLAIWNGAAGNYQFIIDGSNFSSNTLTPYLVDNYLNSSTPLSTSASETVNFAITSDTASYGLNRFKVVFQNATPLSSQSINLNAIKASDGTHVNWTMKDEHDMHSYEVERSTNGTSFDKINTVKADRNDHKPASYSSTDKQVINQDKFYRIKAVMNDNSIFYSGIVRVKDNATSASIIVTPNPVTGESLKVQLDNGDAGMYSVELLNALGQVVYKNTLDHAGGSSSYNLHVGAVLQAKGVYTLKLSNSSDSYTQKIISQ